MAEISHTIRIKAAAKDVFAAVSTDKGVKSWFTPDIEGSVEGGQSAIFRFADGKTFEWQFDEVEPDRRIRWKCLSGPGAAAGSSVTFDLSEASGGDTRVDLEHMGWPEGHEAFATCNTLWGILMGRLKTFAEQSSAVHADAPVIPVKEYIVPGTRVFPEGILYDKEKQRLFTASYGKGSIYRANLDDPQFTELTAAGANGCSSVLGVRMDFKHERLFASGGVSGMAFVFDANDGKMLGRFSNGLAPKELGTAGPGATSPTLINDVAVIDGDAYFTDSYHPILYKVSKEAVAEVGGGQGELDPWLAFEGTALKYTKGDGLASGLNLNGIIATPDQRYLIVVQTNSGKLFRISIADKEVVEIEGEGSKGGDGLFIWNTSAQTKMLIIDMTQPIPLCKLEMTHNFTRYKVLGRYSLTGNISPTNAEIIGDRILITESQLVDVAFGKEPEHPPYRIINYPLSVINE